MLLSRKLAPAQGSPREPPTPIWMEMSCMSQELGRHHMTW